MANTESTARLVLNGDIDITVVNDLRKKIDDELRKGVTRLEIDLTDVDYIDSSGVGILIYVDRSLKPIGGSFSLIGVTDRVMRILSLAGLIDAIPTMRLETEKTLNGAATTSHNKLLWTRSIRVPDDFSAMSEIRNKICDDLAPLGFTEDALFDIKLAFGEALANALGHGRSDDGTCTVIVTTFAYENRTVIEVLDSGRGIGFKPEKLPGLYETRGRGVRLMHMLVDNVDFEHPVSGGTLVRLIKYL